MIGQPLSDLKRINALRWAVDVGRMHSRNNIFVLGDKAFLSSSGEDWNTPDPKDGVYCVDLRLGEVIWFTPTQSDANEVSLIQNVLLVGTDDGAAFAINAEDGSVLSRFRTDNPIYSRAIELETPSASIAVLISYGGDVVQYDFRSNRFNAIGKVPYGVRANPAKIAPNSFLVGSEVGLISKVEILAERVQVDPIFRIESHKASGTYDFNLEIRGISSIVVVGDRVIISYSRNTYDRRPPIACFSLKTRRKLWDAGRIRTLSKNNSVEFGNSRVVPAIWDEQVISTFSYNESVHGFSLETGKWIWRQRLDDSYFQNWSSPVEHNGMLYIARINGVLSVLDIETKKMLASYSVEVFDFSSEISIEEDGWGPWPINAIDMKSGPDPSQRIVAGICSTPAIWEENILVGTVSGKLCCLRPGPRRR